MPYIPKIHPDDTNLEIRHAIQDAHLTHRQIAKAIGVSPQTLSYRFRKELTEAEKGKFLQLIELLADKEVQA